MKRRIVLYLVFTFASSLSFAHQTDAKQAVQRKGSTKKSFGSAVAAGGNLSVPYGTDRFSRIYYTSILGALAIGMALGSVVEVSQKGFQGTIAGLLLVSLLCLFLAIIMFNDIAYITCDARGIRLPGSCDPHFSGSSIFVTEYLPIIPYENISEVKESTEMKTKNKDGKFSMEVKKVINIYTADMRCYQLKIDRIINSKDKYKLLQKLKHHGVKKITRL